MLGKNSGLTYQMVRERYEHFRSRCTKSYKEFDKEFDKGFDKESNKTLKNIEPTPPNDEKGCTEPLYGEKSKCVLQIVPQNTKCDTFQMDSKCVKKHLHDILDK
jgi:hypothetical protein